MQKTTTPATGVPQQFLNRFGDQILGTLCGFDRLRLRGTLRHLFQPNVMEAYLNACGVLIKDFGAFAQKLSRAAFYELRPPIDRTEEFKTYRPSERDFDGPCTWRMLRRGLGDLPRRAELSRACNQRYLAALASTTGSTEISVALVNSCSNPLLSLQCHPRESFSFRKIFLPGPFLASLRLFVRVFLWFVLL